MADTKTAGQIDTADLLKSTEFEADAANMEGVQIREGRLHYSQIVADDRDNLRFFAGQEVGGVKIEKDQRDIPGMVLQIEHIGRITEPLWVTEEADGTFRLKRGFRRYNGAKFIRENEKYKGSPLAAEMENLPVTIVKGMNTVQAKRLVNDQQSLGFTAGEVYRSFVEELRGGASWEAVAYRMYPQIAQVTGSLGKASEVRQEADPEKKRETIKKWLNTFCNQFWRNSILCGWYVEQQTIRQYLWADGFTSQKPDFPVSAPNMVRIAKAFKEDKGAGEYDQSEGFGPRMKKLFDEWKAKANEPKVKKEYQFKPIDDVIQLANMNASDGKYTIVPTIIRLAFKEQAAPDVTAMVNNFDACRTVYNAHAQYLKPELNEILKLVFTSPDGAGGLEELLVKNYATPTDPTPAKVEPGEGETQGVGVGDNPETLHEPEASEGSKPKATHAKKRK